MRVRTQAERMGSSPGPSPHLINLPLLVAMWFAGPGSGPGSVPGPGPVPGPDYAIER